MIEATEGESAEIFNCNKAWDESLFPWIDVAKVEVSEMLSHQENQEMIFSVSAVPPSLAILPAQSLDDYNSVNYLRQKAGIAKKSRLFAYKLFGLPKETPDQRPKEDGK